MEYVYAAMLLHRAGKPIEEDNVTKVLNAAGVKADPVRVKALIAALAEVDIDEAIKAAPALMPTATLAAPAEAAAPAAAQAKEKPKEEKKEEKKEEEAVQGLGALFG